MISSYFSNLFEKYTRKVEFMFIAHTCLYMQNLKLQNTNKIYIYWLYNL